MQAASSSAGYSAAAKTFHWLTAILVIAGWLLGQFGDDLPHAWHQTGLVLHIAIGTTVFLLLIARLIWRFVNPPPPAEKTVLGIAGEIGAKLVHVAIYALLIAIPVAGVVTQFARGHGLPIYGLFEIASPWVRDREFAHSMIGIHALLANTLMVLVLVHAVAALGHHYVLRDGTLRRMLPGTNGRNGVSAHAKVSQA